MCVCVCAVYNVHVNTWRVVLNVVVKKNSCAYIYKLTLKPFTLKVCKLVTMMLLTQNVLVQGYMRNYVYITYNVYIISDKLYSCTKFV